MRPISSFWVACESDPGKLPAFFRLEEITIGGANMRARGGAGTTAQDVLIAHEFAVVLAERARNGAVAGVRRVGAARPFPNVTEYLQQVFVLLEVACRETGRRRQRSGMKQFLFDKIALDWMTYRCALPLEFSRETDARPISVRVGFEVADMRDRLELIDRTKTREGEIPPRALALHPVKRRVPTLFVYRHPAERQPEFRPAVAIVLDECDVFAICDRPCCQRKRGNKRLM